MLLLVPSNVFHKVWKGIVDGFLILNLNIFS